MTSSESWCSTLILPLPHRKGSLWPPSISPLASSGMTSYSEEPSEPLPLTRWCSVFSPLAWGWDGAQSSALITQHLLSKASPQTLPIPHTFLSFYILDWETAGVQSVRGPPSSWMLQKGLCLESGVWDCCLSRNCSVNVLLHKDCFQS